jgi:hypothetical protein
MIDNDAIGQLQEAPTDDRQRLSASVLHRKVGSKTCVDSLSDWLLHMCVGSNLARRAICTASLTLGARYSRAGHLSSAAVAESLEASITSPRGTSPVIRSRAR